MSDRIISIAQVYMAAYSCGITVMFALFIGVGIGALVWYGEGKDRGETQGFERGYDLGFAWGQDQKYKRNAKGQFTK